MSASITFRSWLDVLLGASFVAALAFRLTGDEAHEWIGLVFFVAVLEHNVVNLRWYRALCRGKYGVRRILNTLVNALLVLGALVLCVSGIVNSRHVFAFMSFGGSLGVRQIHSLLAWWALVLVGVHIGLHWEMLAAMAGRVPGLRRISINRAHARVLGALVLAYGVWAFVERDMAGKLFLGFAFDFWNPDQPDMLFFTHNLALIASFAMLTRLVLPGKTIS